MKKIFFLVFCGCIFITHAFADITVEPDANQINEINKLSAIAPAGLTNTTASNNASVAQPATNESATNTTAANQTAEPAINVTAGNATTEPAAENTIAANESTSNSESSGDSYMSIKPAAPIDNSQGKLPIAPETAQNNSTADNAPASITNATATPIEQSASEQNATESAPVSTETSADTDTNSNVDDNTVAEAAVSPDLKQYAVEVPVADYTSVERDKAFMTALQNLLLKVSGAKDMPSLFAKVPSLQKQIKDPSVFVRSYNYASHTTLDKIAPIASQAIPTLTQTTPPATPTTYLQIQFDPAGIAQVLPKSAIQKVPPVTESSKESVVSQVADELKNLGKDDKVADNAKSLETAKPSPKVTTNAKNVISMRINNVKDLDQYANVVKYLRTMPQVTRVDLQNLNSDNVELNVTCIGGINSLLKSLKAPTQHKLVVATPSNNAANTSVVDLNYKWVE